MAEQERTTGTSKALWPRSHDVIIFNQGKLQKTCDMTLAKVEKILTVTQAPTAPPPSGPTWLSRMKENLDRFETLQRVWRKGRDLYKSGPWTFLGWCGYMLGRKLGLW